MITKVCKICGQEKDAGAFRLTGKGNPRGTCWDCEKAAERARWQAEQAAKPKVEKPSAAQYAPDPTKRVKLCKKCGLAKTVEAFKPDPRYRDGYDSWCRDCHRAASLAYAGTERGKARNRVAALRYHNAMVQAKREAANRRKWAATKLLPRTKARACVNQAVKEGRLPTVKTLACAHCGQQACEYHHHKGYAPEHWLDVEPVCKPCHIRITFYNKRPAPCGAGQFQPSQPD